jgi:poly-gamma-glutamate synthesis protein (capsule biosynthesis protein)
VGGARVVIFSFGDKSSGIPSGWAAARDKPGLNLLKDLTVETTHRIAERVMQVKRAGDVVVASIHWGGNWDFSIPREQRDFAHRLIDRAGVDVVYGHSSHHIKGIEVYGKKLILFGCGDFINDYEGIGGYEAFRGDLGLMYFASLDPSTGNLFSLQMTPTKIRRFRVSRATGADALWLTNVLNKEGRTLGTGADFTADNRLTLRW